MLSFFSRGAINSLLSSSSSREGKTSLRWKSTPPSRDDGNSSQATEDVSLLKSRFFFTRKRGDKWNALSIISKSTHRRQNENGLTKRRRVSSSSSSIRKIKKKNTTKKFRTHHTPTQEYVVPKSIPIAGPSDLDMFVCVVVVCVLSNFL